MSKILRTLMAFLVVGTFIVSVSSCKKDDDTPTQNGAGTVSGTVTDDGGAPIDGVAVKISGINETDLTATTGADGKYSVSNVSVKSHSVTFSKTGWQTTSKSVSANDFKDNVATVNASLVNASGKITGKIVDAKNDDAPLEGVAVSVGAAGSVTSAADGTYTIENLVPGAFSVSFTKANYVTVTRSVAATDFVANVATVNVTMGANEVLRGMTAEDLDGARKWYYNEYRGGRNADDYPHFDWACDYMAASFVFSGNWEEQNEGTTLQSRNGEGDQANPADLDVFDSYTYGSKMITADNKILSVRMRTHGPTGVTPLVWGVQVVDLSAAEPAAMKVGDNISYDSEDYTDVEFDLSAYVGKEVIIAIGLYRGATGDYYKQLVLRAVRFANAKVSGTGDWLPGTEVIANWKLTKETVASTMPQTVYSFTGISPTGGNRDNYIDGYKTWQGVNHIGAEWFFAPLKKDPEPFASEGYLIKTRNVSDVSTTVPEAYVYSKFSISAGHDQLQFSTRNFDGTNFTFFKITAIENDGTVTQVEPSNNTATQASAVSDGVWKFINNAGDAADPDSYATFTYDLSAFDGKDVTIVIGVYNGAANTGENKLVFHTIILN
jgi:hypothetical protein